MKKRTKISLPGAISMALILLCVICAPAPAMGFIRHPRRRLERSSCVGDKCAPNRRCSLPFVERAAWASRLSCGLWSIRNRLPNFRRRNRHGH